MAWMPKYKSFGEFGFFYSRKEFIIITHCYWFSDDTQPCVKDIYFDNLSVEQSAKCKQNFHDNAMWDYYCPGP